MADQKTQLDVILNVKGVKELRGLTNSLQGLKNTAKNTSLSTKELLRELNKQSLTAKKTINGTRALANSYKELANAVEFGSQEFKEATAAAARLDAQLKKMQSTSQRGFGSRARGLARGLGAVAAGGIFGGAEGAIGGGIGLALGGAPGALVGSAVGAQVGMARQQIGQIASFSAQLKLQREALRLVIADTEKFNKAQEFLQKTSKELAIPQNLITRQFTSLTASVTGAGKSVEDAQKVFEAIASGIRGTGGSLEDMRAAMVATSQVFSKGKVSAEELRQQLGERLPGAFTLFAESMNKTPAELDKALEQGKVTLDDFMAFAEHLFDKYGENAKILADSPAAAGDRLTTSLTELKDNVGALLQPIGASFQNFSKIAVDALNDVVKGLRDLVDNFGKEKKLLELLSLSKNERQRINTEAKDRAIEQILNTVITQDDIDKILENTKFTINLAGRQERFNKDVQALLGKKLEESKDALFLFQKAFGKNLFDLTGEIRRDMFKEMAEDQGLIDVIKKIREETNGAEESTSKFGSTAKNVLNNVKIGMKTYAETIKDVNKQIQETTVNAFKSMEDALVQFVLTGKLNFRNLAQSIIADITRIVVRQQLITPLLNIGGSLLSGGLGSIFGGSKTIRGVSTGSGLNALDFDDPNASAFSIGGAFGSNGIIPYAKGGVVNKPTIFPFANGIGLMGEAGAEAILPLKRGRSGNLGVEAFGSSNNIVVNVDASGSSVEGDEQGGRELGRLISVAIQSELIQQKRPGGLLA